MWGTERGAAPRVSRPRSADDAQRGALAPGARRLEMLGGARRLEIRGFVAILFVVAERLDHVREGPRAPRVLLDELAVFARSKVAFDDRPGRVLPDTPRIRIADPSYAIDQRLVDDAA